jgi:hypothetical protein
VRATVHPRAPEIGGARGWQRGTVHPRAPETGGARGWSWATDHPRAPSFLCLSQESSDLTSVRSEKSFLPKCVGRKSRFTAQTRGGWIPVTSTGMTEWVGGMVRKGSDGVCGGMLRHPALQRSQIPHATRPKPAGHEGCSGATDHPRAPSFLCLSQESSDLTSVRSERFFLPKSWGGKSLFTAQTCGGWIPVTSTGMTEWVGGMVRNTNDGVCGGMSRIEALQQGQPALPSPAGTRVAAGRQTTPVLRHSCACHRNPAT